MSARGTGASRTASRGTRIPSGMVGTAGTSSVLAVAEVSFAAEELEEELFFFDRRGIELCFAVEDPGDVTVADALPDAGAVVDAGAAFAGGAVWAEGPASAAAPVFAAPAPNEARLRTVPVAGTVSCAGRVGREDLLHVLRKFEAVLVAHDVECHPDLDEHSTEEGDLAVLVFRLRPDVLDVFIQLSVLPPLVRHERLLGVVPNSSETHVDLGGQVVDGGGELVDFGPHLRNLLLDLLELFLELGNLLLGATRISPRLGNLQGHFGLALKLSIHLVLEVVAGHGHKVVNPFFELVEVFDLLGQSEDVCLVTVLKRSNSLGKILDSQAGSLSRRSNTARALHRTGAGTVHAIISEAGGTRGGCLGVESTRRRHGEWLVVALRNIGTFIHLGWGWRS